MNTNWVKLFLITTVLFVGGKLRADDTFVDLLAIYTEDVEAYYGGLDGVEAAIRANLISANESFVNSGIELRVRLVGLRKLEGYQPNFSLSGDLDALTELDGVLDDVFVWQPDEAEGGVGADLVCMFRLNSANGVAGVGWLLDRKEGYAFYSFAVVAMRNALSGLVLQHELGHNFGAAHDRENSDHGLFDYSFGYCFSAPSFSRDPCTLMSYAGDGEFRINYFSNPDINYDGVPMGVASGDLAADNARTLNATKGVISKYFDHIHRLPEANAGIDIEVENRDGSGSQPIDLDGYLSSYEDRIVSWRWSWSGGSATGENPNARFPIGTRTVTLQIEDDEGHVSSDTLRVTVVAYSPIEKVFAGSRVSYFVKENGTSYFFGYGDLDVADVGLYANTPTEISIQNIASIAVGESHTLFLRTNGSLLAVGGTANWRGTDSEQNFIRFAQEIQSGGVTSIAAGASFGLFSKSDGSVWSMGSSGSGALGLGEQTILATPAQVFDSGAQSVFAGRYFSLVLNSNGSLWGMGEILDYVYGDALEIGDRATPREIFNSGVEAVAVGSYHAVVLMDDGSVWTFGKQSASGELGSKYDSYARVPSKVIDGGVVSVYAGYRSTYARLEDGSLLGAGQNTGSSSHLDDEALFKRTLGGHVEDFAVGELHVIALRSDKSLWGKGSNSIGQLGLGDEWFIPVFTEIVDTGASITNANPIANAGSDLLLDGIFQGSSSNVTLDGSGSFDDWIINSWNWTWSGGSVQGEVASGLSFPAGSTIVELEVIDSNGVRNTDTVEVFVSDDADFRSRLLTYFTQEEINAMADVYNADSDQDGLINKGEILLGLDPSEFGSRLKVEEIRSEDGLVIIVRGVSSGVDINLFQSNDLLNWSYAWGLEPEWIDENSVSFDLGATSYEFFKVHIQ